MSDKSDSSVKLFSYSDDQPVDGKGILIPRKGDWHPKHTFTPLNARSSSTRSAKRVALSFFGLCALIILGTSGYGVVSQANLASAPTVTIIDPYTKNATTLEYGPQDSLSKNNLFIETRDAFIEEGLTFIEADISKKQLRFFENGVLLVSAEILRTGDPGSRWGVPSGLYKVERKDEKLFTTTGQVFLPWQITFQGNYIIHGWPTYPGGELVAEDFAGGGIRLSDESAEKLFEHVKKDMPVLVHIDTKETRDQFIYETQIPELDLKHYFVADIDNGTVLASKGYEEQLPVASLVKLMTAVVATEKLSLDGRVRVISPTFVTSLIPRLAERSSVSVYSLLQLLLVESSNEAAETIAGEVGRAEFLEAMNAKARQLGMMNTNFADPSGLSSENVSSIEDLYTLTKYIYKNKRFIFDITANETLSNVYVGGEFDGLVNFNGAEDMDSFIGGKVGETIAAGQTSISLHKIQFQTKDRTLVVILLGSENRTEDIGTLLSYVANRFSH
ncbi:serine hydrolase [Candidatus Nomurabacteria bacterium]|nr:serine hydrolase [Candidatus Kaiserbacteria bacterium]MCB9815114.1 serine hydrolase [Candidatus Nomurabacteria bacterium]